jgi:hypothetical protein
MNVIRKSLKPMSISLAVINVPDWRPGSFCSGDHDWNRNGYGFGSWPGSPRISPLAAGSQRCAGCLHRPGYRFH